MQPRPRKGEGPETRKLSGTKAALLCGAASGFSFSRCTSSASASTWLVKCVQHSSCWAFSCVRNVTVGVETGEVKGRAILGQEGISGSWSPCLSGCESMKDMGTRGGNWGLCKECRIIGFSLNLSCIISVYLFFYFKKPSSP